MATVHNAYYNSPWIADAAKNLASALAPPDRAKLLEEQKLRYEIQRAQELAAMEDEDRQNKNKGAGSMAKVIRLVGEPVRNPLTNQIDREETTRQSLANYADAIEFGGVENVGPGMKAVGPAAPTFAVSEALANQRGNIQSEQIDQRLAGALQLLTVGEQGKDRRQGNLFGHQDAAQQQGFENSMKLLVARQEGQLAQLRERIKGAGGNPLTIAGTNLDDLTRLMYTQVANSGAELRDPREFDELIARAAIIMSTGRNAPTAVLEAYKKHVLPETDYEDGGFWGGERTYLRTHFDDGLFPQAQPGYGTVLAPGAIPGVTPGIQMPAASQPAAPAAPAAAPASAAPTNPKTGRPFQEGETALSKSGKVMIWENGQFVYP